MINYNDTNIFGEYVKQLLHSFNLPNIPTYKTITLRDGSTLTSPQILGAGYYIKDQAIVKFDSPVSSTFSRVGDYLYGHKILNVTKHLEIKSNIYDSYTHEYLGEYLRFLRDYQQLDLMSMYNCFSNMSPNLLNLKFNSSLGREIVFDASDKAYKIYMLPIKLGSVYTIAIESSQPVELVAGIYNKTLDESAVYDALYAFSYKKFNSMNFYTPQLYDVLEAGYSEFNAGTVKAKVKDLKLFVKIPVSNKSSVVILEGDYTSYNQRTFTQHSDTSGTITYDMFPSYNHSIHNYEFTIPDISYISRLQLLDFNDNTSYPFADRLIEYLVNNVVTPLDTIGDNVKRIQKQLNDRYSTTKIVDGVKIRPFIGLKSYAGSYGIWQTQIRPILYDITVGNKLIDKKYDFLGYYDKDIENKLGEDVDIYEGDEI